MKLIGTGSFTKCYLMDCKKKVFLKSIDPIKECMANDWFPSTPLFPKIEYSNGNGVDAYEAKYYPKVKSLKKSLKPAEYAKYKSLRKMWADSGRNMNNFYKCCDMFKTIKNRALKENLTAAAEACSNYGFDVCFEISPRNVAVSKTGKLVLLDCFFMKSALNKRYNY